MVQVESTDASTISNVDAARTGSIRIPKRTWAAWARDTANDLGFKVAMGAASLGFGGAAVSEKQAEAGIMVTGSDPEDYKARGAANVVMNGGDAVYMLSDIMYQEQPFRTIASGSDANRNGIGIVPGELHFEDIYQDFGCTLKIGTESDVVNDPGLLIPVDRIVKNQSGPGTSLWQNGLDFAVFVVEAGIPGAFTLVLPGGSSCNQAKKIGFNAEISSEFSGNFRRIFSHHEPLLDLHMKEIKQRFRREDVDHCQSHRLSCSRFRKTRMSSHDTNA